MTRRAIGILFVLLLVAAAGADARGSGGERWKRERGQLLPLEYANLDIVALGGGRYRAYFMTARGGGIQSAISTDGR